MAALVARELALAAAVFFLAMQPNAEALCSYVHACMHGNECGLVCVGGGKCPQTWREVPPNLEKNLFGHTLYFRCL